MDYSNKKFYKPKIAFCKHLSLALFISIIFLYAVKIESIKAFTNITGSTSFGTEIKEIPLNDFKLENIIGKKKLDLKILTLDGENNAIKFNVANLSTHINLTDGSGSLEGNLIIARVGVSASKKIDNEQRHYVYIKAALGIIDAELQLDYEPGMGAITTSAAKSYIHPTYYKLILRNKITKSYKEFSGTTRSLNNQKIFKFIYPLLFVHGYGGDASSWDQVKTMLEQKGFSFGGHFDLHKPIFGKSLKKSLVGGQFDKLMNLNPGDFYTISLSDNDGLDFKQQGYEVRLAVNAIKHLNSTGKVILIGHSMGGLACRSYIQYSDLYQNDVHALVTMATPHLGSFLAYAYDETVKKPEGSSDLAEKMRKSDYKFIRRYAQYLKTQGVRDNEYPEYRHKLMRVAALVAGIVSGLDPSSPATKYLQPSSQELSDLNKQNIPLDIEYVNVISNYDLDNMKEILLKFIEFYQNLNESGKRIKKTFLDSYAYSSWYINPLLAIKILKQLKNETPSLTRRNIEMAANFIYDDLKNGNIEVSDLYHALICDFLDMCRGNSCLNYYSEKFTIKFSDGVVSVPSQMIQIFPVCRKNMMNKNNDELYKKLSNKVDQQFTDLFHTKVNKEKPEIVTWNAIKKFALFQETYKHIIFVIDSSGSMQKTDPLKVRTSGLKTLLNRMRKDTFISVIDFDDKARVAAAHCDARSEFSKLKRSLDLIDSAGGTHIGKALLQAIKVAQDHQEKAIIFLLTDGINNGREDVLAIAENLSKSIPIYTVGLTGEVNEAMLSKIADITSGRYFKAKSSEHLFLTLNLFLGEVNQEATIFKSAGKIMLGEVLEKVFTVDNLIKRLSVLLSWKGSRIDLEIVKPNGQVITAKNADNFGIRYFQGVNTIIASSDSSEPGQWKLSLIGTDIPSNGEEYHCSVMADSDLIPNVNLKNLYPPGSSIPSKVHIDPTVVSKYSVMMEVKDPEGKKHEISPPDFFRVLREGDYKVTYIIDGHLRDGERFRRILNKQFYVGLQDSKSLQILPIGMVMRWITPGSFTMGDNGGKPNEHPSHNVTITKGFWMAEWEVTQGMWNKIMGYNPSIFKTGANHPVEGVTHAECKEFLKKLSSVSNIECRLPTEAEWEYACRAGTLSKYSWGDEVFPDHVRISDEWSLGHSPVGMFSPNQWGLYDMHSNVWEWCQDWYGKNYYANSPPKDPTGPKEGLYRVSRGGAWSYGENDMRSAKRTSILPSRRMGNLGFRFVVPYQQ